MNKKEKATMRAELLAYTKKYPVERPTTFNYSRLFVRRPAFAIALAVLVVLVSTGTSYAAEKTEPGDVLYPIKIHVNEPVRGALTFGAERKAKWEARRVERRLEELNSLAKKNMLTEVIEQKMQARVERRIKQVEKRIKHFESIKKTDKAKKIRVYMQERMKKHEERIESFYTSNENEIRYSEDGQEDTYTEDHPAKHLIPPDERQRIEKRRTFIRKLQQRFENREESLEEKGVQKQPLETKKHIPSAKPIIKNKIKEKIKPKTEKEAKSIKDTKLRTQLLQPEQKKTWKNIEAKRKEALRTEKKSED